MIFKSFDSTDVVAGRIQPVSTGMWAGGLPVWTSSFYTSSLQTKTLGSSKYEPLNGLYYTNVYDQATSSLSSEVYFALTYGHVAGSGSAATDTDSTTGSLILPTKAIYSQYRNLLLTPGDELFSFTTGSTLTPVNSDHIYVINFKSDKVKDRLDPNQFEIRLVAGSVSRSFISDARYLTDTVSTSGGKRYNIIQGNITGSGGTATYEGIGSMYPDLGIVVLNPDVIGSLFSTTTLSNPSGSSDYALMQNRLYSAIVAGNSIKARVTEYVPSRHYFVRVKNQEFNYSNNPTFVISYSEDPTTAGNLRFADFSSDPKVYPTAVGLYNDNNDLVAVAKLSQPIMKDFSSEVLLKIRLDF